MKKKIIILVIVILTILGLIIGLNLYKKYSNNKRYDEIKEDIQEDIAGYLRVSAPYCEVGNSAGWIITDETLIYVRGMDKEKLLDVDKKSYCKVRVEATCIDKNKWGWNTYLSCKDYEDYEFSHWDQTTEEESKEIIEKVEFNEKEKKIIDTIYNKLNVYQYFDNDNLESFEIINIQQFGYYGSEKNILYMTVYYNSKCKDGTYECDRLAYRKENAIEANRPFSFSIKIDISNYDYIEKINGFATHINSDWVGTSGRVK